MGNMDEMIQIVRAALDPGADAATRQRAATILRSVLAVLETAPGAPLVPPSVAPPAGGGADLLGALIEKFRTFLPPGMETQIPRLAIPLVPVGKAYYMEARDIAAGP